MLQPINPVLHRTILFKPWFEVSAETNGFRPFCFGIGPKRFETTHSKSVSAETDSQWPDSGPTSRQPLVNKIKPQKSAEITQRSNRNQRRQREKVAKNQEKSKVGLKN